MKYKHTYVYGLGSKELNNWFEISFKPRKKLDD